MKAGKMVMAKRIILAAVAIMLIAAAGAQAAVFQYGSLVIVGDAENTYAYDAGKEEEKQTDKAFYEPPDGNFCVYGDKIYFDAGQQLIEYSPDSGDYNRLGSVGYGFNGRTVFAGILNDKLYFTADKGYSDVKRTLNCLDFATGKIIEVGPNVYEACVWDGKLFVAMALPYEDAPDGILYCFGSVAEDFSSILPYSTHAVCPEKTSGHIMWADPDGLYYQEYAVDDATGETTGINLCKLWKDPEDGSFQWACYGTLKSADAHVEYLGTDGEWLLIRFRYPEDESKNEIIMQRLSDGYTGAVRFTGKTGNQMDADVYASSSGFYYMAEDSSLWRLEMTEKEDHLVGYFPRDTSIQGITATDVFYVCAGSLYCTPIEDLMTAVPEEAETQDAARLIGEIEEGLRKMVESYSPSPYIWPEILKQNPQIEPWLREAAGKNLQAVVSLNSGVELSVGMEGQDVRVHIRVGDESTDHQVTLPAGIADMGSVVPLEWQLSDLLKGSRIDVEEGVLDAGIVSTGSGYEINKIPCQVYHAVVSRQTTAEVLQGAMSVLSGLFERFSIDTSRLSDIDGQIASLEELVSDGVSIDFYISDEGCIRIEAAVEKTPRVTGASGGTPEVRHISDSRYTAGVRWSITLFTNQDGLLWNRIDESDIKAAIRISTTTEISSGSYPDRNSANYSLYQYKDEMGYHELISFPLFGLNLGGIRSNNGSLSLLFTPESNSAQLLFNFNTDNIGAYTGLTVSVGAPEVSGSRILIPFTVCGMGSMLKVIPETEGSLALEYR